MAAAISPSVRPGIRTSASPRAATPAAPRVTDTSLAFPTQSQYVTRRCTHSPLRRVRRVRVHRLQHSNFSSLSRQLCFVSRSALAFVTASVRDQTCPIGYLVAQGACGGGKFVDVELTPSSSPMSFAAAVLVRMNGVAMALFLPLLLCRGWFKDAADSVSWREEKAVGSCSSIKASSLRRDNIMPAGGSLPRAKMEECCS
jgi:hypothetical protein